ncbi:MAG TPA: DUF6600 domain-containing protein [Puia sp.]|nr:DUF6600 domain-containing protein [Puia sp.]
MKKRLLYLCIGALALHACGPVYVVRQPTPQPAPATPPPADPEDVSYQTFYDQLSPYGQWVEDPEYGYVWMPSVGEDFKPYASNGHWVYTDEGWTWDSGYPWGWAAFHYGRWFFKDGYGWEWIPGNEWAPAWVAWRNSDDYYGWAPLGPSVSLTVAYDGGYNPPPHYWCFVPHQYVSSPQLGNYYVRETNNVTIINRTTIIRNTTVINNNRNRHYGYGPDAGEVGRYSGSQVHPISIHEIRTPGGQATNGSFAVYRPHVNSAPAGNGNQGNNGRPAYAPTHYQSINNVRPVNRTNYGNPGGQGNSGSEAGTRNNNGNNGNHNGWNNNNGNNGNGNNGNGNNGNGNNGNGNVNNSNGNNGNGNNGNHNGWNNNNGNNGNGNNGNGNVNNSNGNNGNGNNGNGNNGNGNGNNGNGNGNNGNGNGNNGNHNGWNNRSGNPTQSNTPPANTPAVNTPPANTPPANNPPANTQQGRPTTFPGAPSRQTNNPNNGQPQHVFRSNPTLTQQQSTSGRQPQGRPNAQPGNSNQSRPVGNSVKPAPQQQRPPHPPGRPDSKPDNKS